MKINSNKAEWVKPNIVLLEINLTSTTCNPVDVGKFTSGGDALCTNVTS